MKNVYTLFFITSVFLLHVNSGISQTCTDAQRPAQPTASLNPIPKSCPNSTYNLFTAIPDAIVGKSFELHSSPTDPNAGNLIVTTATYSGSGPLYLFAKDDLTGCYSLTGDLVNLSSAECPPPFGCLATAYLFQSLPTDVLSVNLATGTTTTLYNNLPGTTAANGINGVGYNATDGYIWGTQQVTQTVCRVNGDGSVTNFPHLFLGSIQYVCGDVNTNGVLYTLRNDNTIRRFDLNPSSTTYLTELPGVVMTPSITFASFADWAFNPIDGNLYTIGLSTSPTTVYNTLMQINPNTGVRTNLGAVTSSTAIPLADLKGGVFMDNLGNFYFSCNSNGALYKIPYTSGSYSLAAIYQGIAGGSNQNDAARCALAPPCSPPANPVASLQNLSNTCPSLTVDLSAANPAPVSGIEYLWGTNSALPLPSSLLSSTIVSTSGTYYLWARTVPGTDGCYSLTPYKVVVTIYNPCQDCDADGVPNQVDIDDDNDGVLDITECPAQFYKVYTYNRPGPGWSSNAPFTITGQSSQNVVIDQDQAGTDLTFNSVNWKLMASNVVPDATNQITVSLLPTSTTDALYLVADAMLITNGVNTYVIDNSAASGFTTTGTWVAQSISTAYLGNNIFSNTPHSGKTAVWTFTNIPPPTNCDPDNDGLSNTCDLDSDGDGCSDAFEAGATTNQTPNYTFSAPYGANGLANSLENNDTQSATTSYTSTYTTNALNNTINPCCTLEIGGTVYVGPASVNGVDGTPIDGIKALLYMTLWNGNTKIEVQQLDVNGKYKFTGVPAGTYKLVIGNNSAGSSFAAVVPLPTTFTVIKEGGPVVNVPILNRLTAQGDVTPDGKTIIIVDCNAIIYEQARVAATASYLNNDFQINNVSTLPIDLLNLNGKQMDDQINLTWKVANEKDFSHFEVQKSNNGKEFGAIGKVYANKLSIYNHADFNPTEGNNYYRLKMVDIDGTSKLSQVISINFEKGGNYISVENPANNGEFKVMTNLKNPKFILFSALGNRLGITNAENSKNNYTLKAHNVAVGIYYLNIVSEDGKIFTRKIIIP